MPKVRLATASDFETLCEIDHAAFGDHAYDRFALRQFLALFPRSVFLAESDQGEPLGMAVGGYVPPDEPGWVLSVAVVPSARGQGLGRELADRLTRRLAELGALRVRLTVEESNRAGCALYASLGYREVGRDEAYFGRGHARFLMEWTAVSGD